MGLISKTFTLGCAIAGLAVASQMPEFAQQYRQRLAGAVEELRVVVADFDRDADSVGQSRAEALDSMLQSTETFPRERGRSMKRTINRHEHLLDTQKALENAEPVSRPVIMLTSPDAKILEGTWMAFEPAVPLNVPGAVWGGFGALLASLLARLPIGFGRQVRVFRRRVRVNRQDAAIAGNMESQSNDTLIRDTVMRPSDENLQTDNGSLLDQVVKGPAGQQKQAARSLLDDVTLDHRIVGEISRQGEIIRPVRKDG